MDSGARRRARGKPTETPIGFVPTRDALTLDGLDISPETVQELLRVDPADWQKEAEEVGKFFTKFGDRLPAKISDERLRLSERLNLVTSAKG